MPLGFHKAALFGIAGASTESVVLLSTQTANDDDSLAFTSDITSKYYEYIFRFYNINPATDGAFFQFQVNATDQAGYNEVITSTQWYANHAEADNANNLAYLDWDQAQGTAYENLIPGIGNAADENTAGELHLFNPASTTYVKHFYANLNMTQGPTAKSSNVYGAGYINTTTAIDDIKFKMSAGNFDGKIKMWGVK